jgi:hypothetical protein
VKENITINRKNKERRIKEAQKSIDTLKSERKK